MIRATSALAGAALIITAGFYGLVNAAPSFHGYWLWAGLSESDLPPHADRGPLYLYQGNLISSEQAPPSFDRKGLFPHPLKKGEAWLVLRLEGQAVDPAALAGLFQKLAHEWERHGVRIEGLQIDFDAPTAWLTSYGDYLAAVRSKLPRSYRLSVTGLGDWILSGDRSALRRMTNAANEIVFQLYQGRHPIARDENYADLLAQANFPFRLGLLSAGRQDHLIARVKSNPYYRGAVIFIQK